MNYQSGNLAYAGADIITRPYEFYQNEMGNIL